jgi:ribosomal protein S18 acetylase RimI-like enzyme
MTQTEFDAFLERIIPEYAADNVKAGYWDESEALEKSRKETNGLLPQGLQTENHNLYTVYDEDQAVGIVWMRANVNRPTKSGFIFELRVDERFRGKGYGKQAMLLIEEKAREMGLQSIGLHVFAYNDVARSLYEKLGYEASSLNMKKDI